MIKVLTVLVVGSMALGADDPPSTSIVQHRIGETFQQWTNASAEDLIAEATAKCHSKKRPSNWIEKKWRDEACAEITRLNGIRLGSISADIHTRDSERQYDWSFDGGKLSKLTVTPNFGITATEIHRDRPIDEEAAMLIEQYGKPTNSTIRTFQNGYGATWECPQFLWKMQDGTVIAASEVIASSQRTWIVSFLSPAALAKEATAKPNPYASQH